RDPNVFGSGVVRCRAGPTVRLRPFVSVESVLPIVTASRAAVLSSAKWRGALGLNVNGPASLAIASPVSVGTVASAIRRVCWKQLRYGHRTGTNGHERARTDETLNVAGAPLAQHSQLIAKQLRSTFHATSSSELVIEIY